MFVLRQWFYWCIFSNCQVAIQNTDVTNDNIEEEPLIGNQCHNNAVFDVEWVPGQMQLVSASGKHSLFYHFNQNQVIITIFAELARKQYFI